MLSNIDTGTTWETFGTTIRSRLSIYEIGDDGFKLEYEVSTDGGETWWAASRATCQRSED